MRGLGYVAAESVEIRDGNEITVQERMGWVEDGSGRQSSDGLG